VPAKLFGIWLLWAVLCFPAVAGAWVKEPGAAEIITSLALNGGSRAYDDNGDPSKIVDFYKLESAVYGEYGLMPNWSIVGRFAYQDVRLQQNNSIDAKTGFGASQIAIKRKLADYQAWVFSAQAGLSIPGSTENGLDLRLGEGSVEWEVRALAGRSFSVAKRPGFFDVQLSRQFRSALTPDEWRFDLTAGIYPAKKLLLMGQVFTLRGDEAKLPGARTLRSIKAQGSMVWQYRETAGVQLYVSQPVSGRNVVADSSIGIGWWRRF